MQGNKYKIFGLILFYISILFIINFADEPSPITYMVSMRDGIKLATDVYFKKDSCPFPVILIRTPYNKKNKELIPQKYMDRLLNFGYAIVIQDMRGRFSSEGRSFVFFDDGWSEEHQDGYDTVEWIAKQNFSNGKVCTFGGSAMGIVQNMLAGASPPHLKCQVIIVAASSLYHQAAFQGGVFKRGLAKGWLEVNKFPPELLQLFQEHPNYDELWSRVDSETRHSLMNVPALHIGGWFDVFQDGTIRSFKGRQEDGGIGCKGNQKLIIGPWTHEVGSQPEGDLKFPDAEVKDTLLADKIIRFFDYHLKGIENGIMEEPAVDYYLMGDVEAEGDWNTWKKLDYWPPTGETLKLYFHKNNKLEKEPPQQETIYTYIYNPKKPVPTYGGCNLSTFLDGPPGPRDQSNIEKRDDVILFTTDILDEPLKVIGRIKIVLFASSTAKDTDFTAKLTDVYPDGRSILLADGIIRARKREGMEKEVLMEEGKVYQFEIDLWSTAYVFNKGHRIRVAISSSNYPRFDVNPNTGEEFRIIDFHKDKLLSATQKIYCSKIYPSGILLPIVK